MTCTKGKSDKNLRQTKGKKIKERVKVEKVCEGRGDINIKREGKTERRKERGKFFSEKNYK